MIIRRTIDEIIQCLKMKQITAQMNMMTAQIHEQTVQMTDQTPAQIAHRNSQMPTQTEQT